nr:MAG TPA: hypothetical protein [Caudoviricetes sp.]
MPPCKISRSARRPSVKTKKDGNRKPWFGFPTAV